MFLRAGGMFLRAGVNGVNELNLGKEMSKALTRSS